MRLNKHQRAWINRLKSGKTKKTRGVIRDSSGYCCLGVGITACGLEKTKSETEDLEIYPETMKALKISRMGRIDRSLVSKEWLEQMACAHNLVSLNDGLNWSHPKIGRFIDENREAVFME